jgi:hypothetical protein
MPQWGRPLVESCLGMVHPSVWHLVFPPQVSGGSRQPVQTCIWCLWASYRTWDRAACAACSTGQAVPLLRLHQSVSRDTCSRVGAAAGLLCLCGL